MKIAIILSSYNGEKFIEKQIESILNQTLSDFILFIRDDGSTDRTRECIKSFHDSRIHFDYGENVGIIRSFEILFQRAYDYCVDYVFISDQDDVWKANKLENFISAFHHECLSPELVFSDFSTIDENDNLTSYSYYGSSHVLLPKDSLYFPKLLAQPYIFGCAAAINLPLLKLIKSFPDGIEMYDCWISLVASLFGKIHYIDEPTIFHRFHDQNATGKKGADTFLSRIDRLTLSFCKQCKNTHLRVSQIGLLITNYQETMSNYDFSYLKDMQTFLTERNRFKAVLALNRYGIKRGALLQNLFFKLTFFFAKE